MAAVGPMLVQGDLPLSAAKQIARLQRLTLGSKWWRAPWFNRTRPRKVLWIGLADEAGLWARLWAVRYLEMWRAWTRMGWGVAVAPPALHPFDYILTHPRRGVTLLALFDEVRAEEDEEGLWAKLAAVECPQAWKKLAYYYPRSGGRRRLQLRQGVWK